MDVGNLPFFKETIVQAVSPWDHGYTHKEDSYRQVS